MIKSRRAVFVSRGGKASLLKALAVAVMLAVFCPVASFATPTYLHDPTAPNAPNAPIALTNTSSASELPNAHVPKSASRRSAIARFAGFLAAEAGSVAPDLENLSPKIENDLLKRGWTPQEIQEAYENGEVVPAVNKANGEAATRYINPTTAKSVVIENGTGQVIHVGGDGFKYGPGSGDLP